MQSMNFTPDDKERQDWLSFIDGYTRYINIIHFFSRYRYEVLFWLWGLGLCFLANRLSSELNLLWIFYGIISAAWLLSCLIRFKKLVFSKNDVINLLDKKLETHHALHCAYHQLGAWPNKKVLEKAKSVLTFSPKPFFLPVSMGFSLVLLALFWPITQMTEDKNHPTANHWQLESIEQQLDELEEDKYLDEDILEKWNEQLEEMKDSHSEEIDQAALLEVSDRLEENISMAVGETENVLEQMSAVTAQLSQLQAQNPNSSSIKKNNQRLNDLLKQAQEMQLSWEPPKDAISHNTLSEINKSMDSKKLQSLSEAIEASLSSCKQCQGKGKKKVAMNGKIKRGRNDAEMTYGKQEAPLPVKTFKALPEAKALSLGEVIDTQLKAPQVEATNTLIRETGQKAKQGNQDSGVIWKMKLKPNERQFLNRQGHD